MTRRKKPLLTMDHMSNSPLVHQLKKEIQCKNVAINHESRVPHMRPIETLDHVLECYILQLLDNQEIH